ncbi:right-handed parallel beta-helix repeat-containing protein [Pseudorhodobacter turbinis]|uniref:right-handed parallel beta-helix repeat-containing protein n=1 Tax=Pseudorhodobacter turbinis TaxID=2500533 RepID=UPI00143DF045|nr:right-handed parallel beta-helix repeat-containing protein [Pseudorhodobacter turbinis]
MVLRGTNIHSIRMDGMNFPQVENVLIENNHIHDFSRSLESKDHADMIQFRTNKTDKPSRDIVIRDNLLNSGKGAYSQSIFMRNEEVDTGRSDTEMFYRNVTIENNMIINAHLHGITVGETDGLIIRRNTVVRNGRSEGKKKNPALWTPQIRVNKSSRNVLITRNITNKITGEVGQADWRVTKNYPVQDLARGKSGFYGQVFDHSVLNDPTRPEAFRPQKGGPLDGADLGARLPVF